MSRFFLVGSSAINVDEVQSVSIEVYDEHTDVVFYFRSHSGLHTHPAKSEDDAKNIFREFIRFVDEVES